jgi:hypothetical protein
MKQELDFYVGFGNYRHRVVLSLISAYSWYSRRAHCWSLINVDVSRIGNVFTIVFVLLGIGFRFWIYLKPIDLREYK